MTSELTYKLFIDDEWTDGSGSELLEVVNPASEERIGGVPQATAGDVVAGIEAARRAFDEGPWPRMTARERSGVLVRMAEVMERRRDELGELSVAEAGSTRALASSLQVGAPIEHFADMAERVLPGFAFAEPMSPHVAPNVGVSQGVVTREPFGVAALITPFNFPFMLNVFKLAAALAAGCTTVLKPSPHTPLEAFVLGEIAQEAGLPPGVLNVVTGGVDAGAELTQNPMVDIVSFTGSDAVGRKVYQQGAESLKKVILELGGKSANIIFPDADLDKVAQDVILNCTLHAGQGCVLNTRTLVHESVHDDLVARVKAGLDYVTVGDPADANTVMGPLIREQQRQRVEGFIRQALEEGAQLAYGGGRPSHLDRGFFVEPTLFVDVTNTMAIAQREVFGPVGVVIPFGDEEEAVRLANESDYGLGAGVWSGDVTRAYSVAAQMRAGFVSINGFPPGLNPDAAFGGYKHSGLGREWGAWGLSEFLQHKSIVWSVG